MRSVFAIAGVVAVTLAGLILMRLVTSVTAAPPLAGQARGSGVGGSSLPSVRGVPENATTDIAVSEEMLAAHEEALRLGREALATDDLETARGFYFLAVQAVPSDAEARRLLRAVDTARAIGERRSNWNEAIGDLEELATLAPSAGTVVRAYLDALVGGGLEALAQGNALRAQRLCSEANYWVPSRSDARQCFFDAAAQLGPAATAVARPPERPIAIAPPSPMPLPRTAEATVAITTAPPQPTATFRPTEAPLPTALPTVVEEPEPSILELATEVPAETATPMATEAPAETATPIATATHAATSTPVATATPVPTATPMPTATLTAAATPTPQEAPAAATSTVQPTAGPVRD